MRIEIIDKEGSEIVSFELSSNPFKVGEILNLQIQDEYIIEKIEHFFRREHIGNQISEVFCTSVEVRKINPIE